MRVRLRHRRLAQAIASSRMSQNRWAIKLGISTGHLSELANGKRPYPAPATRRKLCRGLGMPFEELFEVETEVGQAGSANSSRQPPRKPLLKLRGRRYQLRVDRLPPSGPQGEENMQSIVQDFRYGARWLTRNPGFALVAVLALALGIGGNTAIFSLVQAVVLNPLAYDDPERMVMVWETDSQTGRQDASVAYPNMLDWMEPGTPLESAAVFRPTSYTLMQNGSSERVVGARVSGDFFRVLRVEAVHGRLFEADDDKPGSADAAMVSHGFWMSRLGGDPGVIGRPLVLDGTTFSLVGVLPAGFSFPIEITDAQIFTPMAQDGEFAGERGMHAYKALARLRPGVSLQQAQQSLQAVAQSLAEQYPDDQAGRGIRLVPLHRQVTGDVRPALLALLAVVGCVLLIACANVANLLLARGASRRRELAVRTALGAGRTRLVRQLMCESLLLAAGGGVLGLVLTWSLLGIFVAAVPVEIPRLQDVSINPTVLLFTLGVTLLTGVLFGMAPAWQASRTNLQDNLADGGRGSVTAGGSRLRSCLVAAEVALALLLLVGAGLMVRSFVNLLQVEPGYNPRNVLTFTMSVPLSEEGFSPRRAEFYSRVLQAAKQLPEVRPAGMAVNLPLSGNITTEFLPEGRQARPGEDRSVQYNSVSANYFQTLEIPLLRGRTFQEEDRLERPGVAIINQTMARRHWPESDPIGRNITIDIGLGQAGEPMTFQIIGVVGDVHTEGLEAEVRPQVYVHYRQHTWPFAQFVLRTTGDPLRLTEAVRRRVAEIDPTQPIYKIATLDQQLSDSLSQRRFTMLALGGFSLLALMLASLGIYGVIAYWVGRRTREIGLRIALGARRRDVLGLVLRTGLAPVLAGLALGSAASMALTRWVASLLFQLDPLDPATYLSVSLLLTAVSLLACYLPAHRATRVDPLTALRAE